jgi:hypothetical protein
MAEKPMFWDEELREKLLSIECDGDIEREFNATCLGAVDDLLPVNPYGYRAWVWLGKYKDRDAVIISWDCGNGCAEAIDFMYPTKEEIEELITRSE